MEGEGKELIFRGWGERGLDVVGEERGVTGNGNKRGIRIWVGV